jgi:hypothetical protein
MLVIIWVAYAICGGVPSPRGQVTEEVRQPSKPFSIGENQERGLGFSFVALVYEMNKLFKDDLGL